jgi:hypothetical protein
MLLIRYLLPSRVLRLIQAHNLQTTGCVSLVDIVQNYVLW